MARERLPHLLIVGRLGVEPYTYAGAIPMGTVSLPPRDRLSHGSMLIEQLKLARAANEGLRGVTSKPDDPAPIALEVRGEPGFPLNLDRLEPRGKNVEIACIHKDGDVEVAVLHVPEGALTHFLKRVEEYLEKDTAKGSPKHSDLVDRIAEWKVATLRSFWAEDPTKFEFPANGQAIWWEVWLRASGKQSPWDRFRLMAEHAGLKVEGETIHFPDRDVGLVFGTPEQLSSSADMLDMMGEIRRAKENPAAFIALTPKDQGEWVDSLLQRLTPPPPTAPSVCILDSGVVLHPLLRPAINVGDCHTYDPRWPPADVESFAALTHGTEMAGVCLYGGRLADLLANAWPVSLRHRLESVRILPPLGFEPNEPRLYGYITSQAASLVEIANPTRQRSFCLPVTTDGADEGRPSSWSGVVDQLCAGVDDDNRRLFFVSAGNSDPSRRHLYPDSNQTDPVQDPAQAWNAVAVGACTFLVGFGQSDPVFAGCTPIAEPGDLSPSSTTSLIWGREWPYKPDIVLEGGNELRKPDSTLVFAPDEMAMLTTAHATSGRLLVDFRDTSAAVAQAASMAAELQAEYPDFWPETIRALMVHSAEWTDPMRRAFGKTKAGCARRLRQYGYGVPSLARAMHSARSSLTLIAQESIQPYVKKGSAVQTHEMGLHDLPWPRQQLLDLQDHPVMMRVTLSYFIEPKPGRDGFAQTRHRYQSHGLRFEVRRPGEPLDVFRKRVSKAARDEDEAFSPVGDTSGWELGPLNRTRGSLHSDWWRGIAADLADSSNIAVYPVTGWWREAPGEHWRKRARYSLVVSIRTEGVDVDIYTPVQAMIAVPVEIATEVEIE